MSHPLGLKKLVMDLVPCASLAKLTCLVSSAFLRAAALGSTCAYWWRPDEACWGKDGGCVNGA